MNYRRIAGMEMEKNVIFAIRDDFLSAIRNWGLNENGNMQNLYSFIIQMKQWNLLNLNLKIILYLFALYEILIFIY